MRTSIVLPRTQAMGTGSRGVAISPNGSHITYIANGQLCIRALNQSAAVYVVKPIRTSKAVS